MKILYHVEVQTETMFEEKSSVCFVGSRFVKIEKKNRSVMLMTLKTLKESYLVIPCF